MILLELDNGYWDDFFSTHFTKKRNKKEGMGKKVKKEETVRKFK